MTIPGFQRILKLFWHAFKSFWIFSYNQLFSFLSYKIFEEFGTFLHILIFPSLSRGLVHFVKLLKVNLISSPQQI